MDNKYCEGGIQYLTSNIICTITLNCFLNKNTCQLSPYDIREGHSSNHTALKINNQAKIQENKKFMLPIPRTWGW